MTPPGLGAIIVILILVVAAWAALKPRPSSPPLRPLAPSLRPLAPPLQPPTPPLRPLAPPLHPLVPPLRPLAPPLRPLAPPLRPLAPPLRPLIPPLRPLAPPLRPLVPPLRPLASRAILYGAGNDGKTLYSATLPNGAWAAIGPSHGVDTLAYNPLDGKLYGLGDGLLLSAVPGRAWGPVPNGEPPGGPLSSIAFDSAGAMWGITINNFLVTKGTNPEAPWVAVTPGTPLGNGVYNIAFDASGAMWGVSRTGAIYKKPAHALTGPWTQISHVGPPVLNIHIDRSTGHFYGIGNAWLVYESPDLTKVPWAVVPGVAAGPPVQDIAVAPATR